MRTPRVLTSAASSRFAFGRVGSRGNIPGVIAFEHVSEMASVVVDAPKLVRTWDEFTILVPALNPSDAVVKAEESRKVGFPAGALGFAMHLSHQIVGSKKIAFQDLGVLDLNGRCHLDVLAYCYLLFLRYDIVRFWQIV